MKSGTESARSEPALTLSHEELLLLEAVLCFHARASTSADLRARLADLWERVGRARMAAAPPRRARAGTAQADCAAGSPGAPAGEPRRG